MLPLRDENPTVRTPVLTVGLIGLCILVFFLQMGAGPEEQGTIVYRFGLVPAVFFGHGRLAPEIGAMPAMLTLFTSMFLHGGWMHLGSNMLFLWIFGNNIEDVLGHVRFIIFYVLSGVAAGFAQMLVDTSSAVPMIGASGAIAGILAAYMLLFPKAKVVTLIWLGFFVTTVRISAVWFLGIWLAMQWLNALGGPEGGGGVAWWAHLGGFGAGLLLILVLKPGGVFPTRRQKGPWE